MSEKIVLIEKQVDNIGVPPEVSIERGDRDALDWVVALELDEARRMPLHYDGYSSEENAYYRLHDVGRVWACEDMLYIHDSRDSNDSCNGHAERGGL